ncbi:MAG: TIGR03943 family protein [Phormidesmis sp.]
MRSPRPTSRSAHRATKPPFRLPWRDILDALALGMWSAMLFRYWIGGKLTLLLHPDYAWLSNTAAIVLSLLAMFTFFKALSRVFGRRSSADKSTADGSHVTLLPPSISSALLLGIAVFGLIYTPRAFASQTATQRGISDTLTLTRAQPQRFARATASEDRSIIDWIRLVNVYPEPDEYEGEAVNVKGFVLYPPEWPEGYLMVSRFVLTCCAADAYPVGLPVKLTDSQERYPTDSWLEVSGQIVTETLNERRQLVIAPTNITAIEEPKNPYEYQ